MAVLFELQKEQELLNLLETKGSGVFDKEANKELTWNQAALRLTFGKNWETSDSYLEHNSRIGGMPKGYLDNLQSLISTMPSWAEIQEHKC